MHKGWFFLIVPCLLLVLLIDRPDILQTGNRDNEGTTEISFDSWSTEISTILFNAEGEIEYTMQATRQMHFLDNITVLENPYLSLYQVDGGRWNITAETGRLMPAAADREASNNISVIDRIDLIENVELYQVDDFDNRTVLSTSFLTLDPQLETLSTDQPVHFHGSTIEQTALGMHADLTQNTVTFLSQVRGRYDASATR